MGLILILGEASTSGLGSAFMLRWCSAPKNVILTVRNPIFCFTTWVDSKWGEDLTPFFK